VGDGADTSLADLVRAESRARGLGRLLGRLVDLPVVGPLLARLARLPNQITPVSTRISRFHSWLLRRSGGRLRRSWLFAAGQPVISLTTTGRKSGKPRSTAVACFVEGDELVSAGMNLGKSSHPAWALNLMANPQATIAIAGESVEVVARKAEGEERERLWRRWVELQPSADAFEDLAGREIPLFVLSRR
jgi:deazaflavin-dependent oxidoreductase (nitroreductase family)